MNVRSTEIQGAYLLQPRIFTDMRGVFVKTYQERLFHEVGISFLPKEEFYSISHCSVVRGMHFQRPPAAHDKLVFCTTGRVLDVILDLRRQSPTFGKSDVCELSGANHAMLFIPVGCAHGFLALEDNTTMFYQTSSMHSPEHDTGVLWNSFGFRWPITQPILSARDQCLPAFTPDGSPF